MRQKVFFQNMDGEKLAGNLFDAGGDRCVIYCHGLASSKDSYSEGKEKLAMMLEAEGISILYFDFSGCGESEGKFEKLSLTKYCRDLVSAIEFTSQKYRKIGLAGSSLGAAVSIIIGEKRGECIFCIAPPTDFKEVFRNLIRQYRIGGLDKWKEHGFTKYKAYGKKKIFRLGFGFYRDTKKYDFRKIAGNISKPMGIVHGIHDEVVPVHQSENLLKLTKKGHLDTMDCGHMFRGRDFDAMAELFVGFMKKNL